MFGACILIFSITWFGICLVLAKYSAQELCNIIGMYDLLTFWIECSVVIFKCNLLCGLSMYFHEQLDHIEIKSTASILFQVGSMPAFIVYIHLLTFGGSVLS